MEDVIDLSPIKSFYAEKNVFITGATGFLGKVLLEKLLYSCEDINEIFILVRKKKELSAEKRLEQILDTPVFERLKNEFPKSLAKIQLIEGDITQPLLGISTKDFEILKEKVHVIFHSAASVKYNETLKESVITNLLGTKHVVDLARKTSYLLAFIHVSTAYCNCNLKKIEEKIYPSPICATDLIGLVDWMPEDLMECLVQKLKLDRPNIYTLTKAVSESFLEEQAKDLPVAIIRPSIITASWKEPFPGWVELLNGPTGIFFAAIMGFQKTLLLKSSAVADFVPIDIVINTMISTAWITAKKEKRTLNKSGPRVYNCVSCQCNPLTWGEVFVHANNAVCNYPSIRSIRNPGMSCTTSEIKYSFRIFFENKVIPMIFDAFSILRGRVAKATRICQKALLAVNSRNYFTSRDWEIDSNNLDLASQSLSGTDIEEFNFDMKSLDWPSYIENCVLGMRKHIMKEDLDNLKEAKSRIVKISGLQSLFGHLIVTVPISFFFLTLFITCYEF